MDSKDKSSSKDTGIYDHAPREPIFRPDQPLDCERALPWALEQRDEAINVEGYLLPEVEDAADRVLEADRLDRWEWEADRETTVATATNVRVLAAFVRAEIAKGDSTTVAAMMFHLGRRYERLRVKFAEPRARTGASVRRGSELGAAATHGTPEEREGKRRSRYEAYVKALAKYGNERGAKEAAIKDAAAECKCDRSQIIRARKYFEKS